MSLQFEIAPPQAVKGSGIWDSHLNPLFFYFSLVSVFMWIFPGIEVLIGFAFDSNLLWLSLYFSLATAHSSPDYSPTSGSGSVVLSIFPICAEIFGGTKDADIFDDIKSKSQKTNYIPSKQSFIL